MNLTQSQKDAIYSTNNNILVNASAGSGKTSVFAARMTHLIKDEGVNPKRILALSFSKEATENMRKRVSTILGKKKSSEIHMSTFHSFAYSLLYSNYAPFYKNTQMMKDWWKINQLYSIAGVSSAINPSGLGLTISGPELGMFISYQKANMILKNMPVLIDENTSYVDESMRSKLQEAYGMYMDRCKNARLIEYDDLLLHLIIDL